MATRTTPGLDHAKLLRATNTLQTAMVFVQFITAGLLLSIRSGHVFHSTGAYILWFVAIAHLIVAILAWRSGGGSPKPVYYALGFVALITAQVYLGVFHITALHVPLAGVLLIASLAYLLRLRASR